MSKLEYLISIAYYLGNMDKDGIEMDLDRVDIEDLLILSSRILDDFYAQNEVSYLSEFLSEVGAGYINEKCSQLF